MKHTKTVLCLVSVLIVQISFSHAQGKPDGLLAAPYPGSIFESNPGISGARKALIDARSRTFYAKDPMENVKAHYTKLLGPFEVSSADNVFTREVVPFKDVVAIVTKKGAKVEEGGDDFYGGTFAGVTVYGKPTNDNYSVVKVFDELLKAYLLKFQNNENSDPLETIKHAEDPEVKQMQARYEHLKRSYFMQTGEKRKDAVPGYLSTDEVIYDKYFVAPEEARTKELGELQKKMTALSTSMKYDEATKVGDRIMKLTIGPKDPKEQMSIVMNCLAEMDKAAYATKIVIDMHPSKWDLTPAKQ